MSARGAKQLFAGRLVSRAASTRRGRRHPAGDRGSVVGAARRLRCDARSGVAPHNSLRSLRSLRSDRCGESVHEARWRAPTPELRFSPPLYSPRPGAACRAATDCAARAEDNERYRQRCVRAGRSAHERRRASQGSWPRAYPRASSSDSSRLSERRERSERSELRDGPRGREGEPGREPSGGRFVPGERPGRQARRGLQGQGSRRAAQTAEDKCCGLPARALLARKQLRERPHRAASRHMAYRNDRSRMGMKCPRAVRARPATSDRPPTRSRRAPRTAPSTPGPRPRRGRASRAPSTSAAAPGSAAPC